MLGCLLPRPEPRKLCMLFALFAGIWGDCGWPPVLNSAVPQRDLHAESFPDGTEVPYRCVDGFYHMHGKTDVTTCLENSQWSPIEEFCENRCPVPVSLKYAAPKPEELRKKTHYTPGTALTYVCQPGYEPIPGRTPVLTCLPNNSWSEVPAFCKGKSCGDPGKPQNGRTVVATDLLYRSKVHFTCDDGHRLIGPPSAQCVMKGDTVKWDKEPPRCQPITCSPPPNIAAGAHDGGGSTEDFPYNSTVTYKCQNGFSLVGEASIRCTTEDKAKGVWRGPPPKCTALARLVATPAMPPSTIEDVQNDTSPSPPPSSSPNHHRQLWAPTLWLVCSYVLPVSQMW
ncbi:complement decay-accelerating factor-like [Sphaerodactylus townsendi]|uniref:complement decay-accelerating factor-like n=1 Tax=Sphaerodactylus townsendi TaxID=933632 RepID=UPI0020271255|nr:complement decay-accelerating factor-like [Sphaerodactylus townsendi]